MATYTIHKGVGMPAQIGGLTLKYLFPLCAILAGIFLLTVLFSMAGVSQSTCLMTGALAAVTAVYAVFTLSRRYGEYGLMKRYAKSRMPGYIVRRKRVYAIVRQENKQNREY